MPDYFTFWLIVLAILVTYLCTSIRRRQMAEEARWRELEKQFPGKALDVSAIAPRVQRGRENHFLAANSLPRRALHRTGLLVAARRLVSSLAYFRLVRHETELRHHQV